MNDKINTKKEVINLVPKQLFVKVIQEQNPTKPGAESSPTLRGLLVHQQRFHLQRYHTRLSCLVLTIQDELRSHLLFLGKEVIN